MLTVSYFFSFYCYDEIDLFCVYRLFVYVCVCRLCRLKDAHSSGTKSPVAVPLITANAICSTTISLLTSTKPASSAKPVADR